MRLSQGAQLGVVVGVARRTPHELHARQHNNEELVEFWHAVGFDAEGYFAHGGAVVDEDQGSRHLLIVLSRLGLLFIQHLRLKHNATSMNEISVHFIIFIILNKSIIVISQI